MSERVSSTRTRYRGKMLQLDEVEVVMPNGHKSVREVIRHPGAAVILARHPDGRFAFVRQYRTAVDMDLLETVAGCLNPGEPPVESARRELREETGHQASRIVPLGVVFPAPGYTNEAMHLFFAELDPVPVPLPPDEDENISVEWVTAAQIESMISDGSIRDAKTLAIWLLYGRLKP